MPDRPELDYERHQIDDRPMSLVELFTGFFFGTFFGLAFLTAFTIPLLYVLSPRMASTISAVGACVLLIWMASYVESHLERRGLFLGALLSTPVPPGMAVLVWVVTI